MMACCPRQYLQGSDSGETPLFVGFSHLGWERSGPTLVSIRGAHKFSLAPCCLDERVTKWYHNVWFHCQVFFPYTEIEYFASFIYFNGCRSTLFSMFFLSCGRDIRKGTQGSLLAWRAASLLLGRLLMLY